MSDCQGGVLLQRPEAACGGHEAEMARQIALHHENAPAHTDMDIVMHMYFFFIFFPIFSFILFYRNYSFFLLFPFPFGEL